MSAISWVSHKQVVLALYSTESEFIAAAEAYAELLLLKKWMKDFGTEEESSRDLREEKQSCIKLVQREK